MTWTESVEEALCVAWMTLSAKGLNDEPYREGDRISFQRGPSRPGCARAAEFARESERARGATRLQPLRRN
jgi:hypothetical protein